jgi:hypothetical protein
MEHPVPDFHLDLAEVRKKARPPFGDRAALFY